MRKLSLFILTVLVGCSSASGSGNPGAAPGGGVNKAAITLDATEVAVGLYHSCVIAAHQVKCWGDRHAAKVPDGLKNPRQLVAGDNFSCVLTDDGVKCWSINTEFSHQTDADNPPHDLQNPSAIFAGVYTACAIVDSTVRCWGSLKGDHVFKNPTRVAIGYDNACAITDEGVKCWGNDDRGKSTPPPDLKHPRDLALGWSHACALTDDGVTCWGDIKTKNLLFSSISKINSIAAFGTDFTCAIGHEGVSCWDRSYDSSMSTGRRDYPNIRSFVASRTHSCAIDDKGVECSQDVRGEDGPRGSTHVPTGLINPTLFTTGYNRVCASTDDGVKCWGNGREYDLANSEKFSSPPTSIANGWMNCAVVEKQVRCWGGEMRPQVPDWRGVTQIAFINEALCGLVNGKLICQRDFRLEPPINTPDLKNARELAAKNSHLCAIDDDGVTCMMQAGSYKYRSYTAPIPLRNPNHLAVNPNDACVIEGNTVKFVRCWNAQGQILPVPELENPTELAMGESQTCANTDLGIKCWGPGAISPPTDLKHPRHLFASENFACAVTDEGLRCWGDSEATLVPDYNLVK